MGYYTHYHLEVMEKNEHNGLSEPVENVVKEIKRVLTEILGGDADYAYDIEDMLEGTAEMKWYNHTENMKALAKAFPNIYFTLEGEGEDREDYWVKQFHDDEYYESYAEIIEPEKRW